MLRSTANRAFALGCCFVLGLPAQSSTAELAVTEVMWKSSHPEENPETLSGGLATGDWFELFNAGDTPINLEGYLFDDDDQLFGNDYAVWPAVEIQPGEVLIVLREDDANKPFGFRSAWGLSTDFRIMAECIIGGGDPFSGLSSGGDELNIYSPTAVDEDGLPTGEAPLISIPLPAATTGFSLQWDADGNPLGLSQDGVNGSFTALHDGSETDPPYLALDVASPGFVAGLGAPLFPNQPHLGCPSENPSGDFDNDGDYSCADVNALVAEIVSGNNSAEFDLDGNGLVDDTDLSAWLAEAGAAELSSAGAYLRGDANLDGVVDVSDFNAWNTAKFTTNPSWCDGDFNADGTIDVSDFNIWNSAKFQAADGTAAVPEPSGVLLPIWAAVSVWLGLRRRRWSNTIMAFAAPR